PSQQVNGTSDQRDTPPASEPDQALLGLPLTRAIPHQPADPIPQPNDGHDGPPRIVLAVGAGLFDAGGQPTVGLVQEVVGQTSMKATTTTVICGSDPALVV
ncbi:hypothetical protein, partial [Streptomyces sp. 8L]|uniref:hypothetical protein n=1 Tax=Streptomyces sp. 8L TaxID=2877242 RepID=UPI001CD46EE9